MTRYPEHWDQDTINRYNELQSELERHQQKVANGRIEKRNYENVSWPEWGKRQDGEREYIKASLRENADKAKPQG